MSDSLDRLLDLLDLEQIESDIFRGRSPDETLQRVFGGQVAGQALVAAGRTVPGDRPVHSLHAYFIRPGDPSVPLVYTVDRVRDGRSFTTRRVTAIQHGKPIFTPVGPRSTAASTASSTRRRCRPCRRRGNCGPMPSGSPPRPAARCPLTCATARSTCARWDRCRSSSPATGRCAAATSTATSSGCGLPSGCQTTRCCTCA